MLAIRTILALLMCLWQGDATENVSTNTLSPNRTPIGANIRSENNSVPSVLIQANMPPNMSGRLRGSLHQGYEYQVGVVRPTVSTILPPTIHPSGRYPRQLRRATLATVTQAA